MPSKQRAAGTAVAHPTTPSKRLRARSGLALATGLALIAGAVGDAASAVALRTRQASCSGVTAAKTIHHGCLLARGGERVGPASAPRFEASQVSALPVVALPAGGAAKLSNDSLSGVVQGVLGTLGNPVGAGAGALAGVGLNALDSWVLSGADAALASTATAIATTTAPQLQSTWFASMYWRVAALGALLTLPFLFAAAAQALLRSDLSLLARAAFGYLPMALLGVSLAAPLTMLLLAATDQMCAVVAGIGQNGGVHFLTSAALAAGSASALDGSPFLGFLVGLFIVAAAIALLLELLIREAAVYVVVLMLPLAFAAFVWPARRSLAVRTVELLIALILSKFVVVAVLSLGGAAFGQSTDSSARLLTAMALVLMSTFAPVALFRLIPFAELAAGASSAIRSELPRSAATARATGGAAQAVSGYLGEASEWLADASAQMRNQARDAGQAGGRAPLHPALPTGAPEHAGQGADIAGAAGPDSAGAAPRPGATNAAVSDASVGAGDSRPASPEAALVDAASGVEEVVAPSIAGAPRSGQADGLETALQANNLTMKLRLGMEHEGRPAFRLAEDAAGAQSERPDSLPEPLPLPGEGGLL